MEKSEARAYVEIRFFVVVVEKQPLRKHVTSVSVGAPLCLYVSIEHLNTVTQQ